MKHIFIINPMSGSHNQSEETKESINKLHYIDSDIYVTKERKDATRFVREYIRNNPDVETRFYACGGDGTINEVMQGLVGADQKLFSMSCYPVGSGNDYIKIFGGKEKFLDLDHLVKAQNRLVDVIEVNHGEAYSINVVNYGFDSNVARTMEKIKREKNTTNEKAYMSAVFSCLLKCRHNKGDTFIGEEKITGKEFLLATIANGQYVGGQFKCAPKSICDDGYMDVCIVKPVSILRFLSILIPYTKGMHLDMKSMKKIVTYRRTAEEITITGPEGFCICLDGEMMYGERFTVKILKQAVNFAVPE